MKFAVINWKTTVLGIASIVAAVAGVVVTVLDGDPTTVPDFEMLFHLIAIAFAGGGLVAASDPR